MITISPAQEIIDRLKKATQAASDSELARIIGVSQQAVSSARKGKVPDSWARVALSRFGVSADWLYTGSGPMLHDERLPHRNADVRPRAASSGEDVTGRLEQAERLAEERGRAMRELEAELDEARKAERRALLEANNALKRLLPPFAPGPEDSD